MIFFFGLLVLSACSSETTESGNEEAPKEEEKVYTIRELLDGYSEKGDEFLGQEITVQGYSWGVAERTDGTKSVSMGDEKLDGMQQSKFYAKFSEKNAADADAFEKDKLIKCSGKLNHSGYNLEILDCGCEVVE